MAYTFIKSQKGFLKVSYAELYLKAQGFQQDHKVKTSFFRTGESARIEKAVNGKEYRIDYYKVAL